VGKIFWKKILMLKAILTFILGNVSKIIFLISIAKIMVLIDITLKKDVKFRERNKTLKISLKC
jgi:hypothetical protein